MFLCPFFLLLLFQADSFSSFTYIHAFIYSLLRVNNNITCSLKKIINVSVAIHISVMLCCDDDGESNVLRQVDIIIIGVVGKNQ